MAVPPVEIVPALLIQSIPQYLIQYLTGSCKSCHRQPLSVGRITGGLAMGVFKSR